MKYLTLSLLCLLLATHVRAQTKAKPKPATPDERAVVAAVQTLFDAMRTADTTLARSVMAPNFRMIILGQNPAKETVTREVTGKQFVTQIASRPAQTLDERFWDGHVQLDGDLASYWCKYAFFLNGKFSHCGTDVFQLYRSPQGWKMVNLAYNIQQEGCDMKAIPGK
jgi:hypothetical protein